MKYSKLFFFIQFIIFFRLVISPLYFINLILLEYCFKKYLPNNLSFYSVIKFLEVFNIYSDNITSSLYKEIKQFVEQNIIDYKKLFISNNKTYVKINTNAEKKTPIYAQNTMLDILSSNKSLETIVLNAYKLEKNNYSNSEILSKIMQIDYGKLFSIALVKINMDLQVTSLVENFVQKYEQLIIDKQSGKNICKIISKKYSTTDELLSDNVKVIYVDPKYDKTNYNILNKMEGGKMDNTKPNFLKIYKNLDLNELAKKQENNAILLKNILEEQNKNKINYKTGEIVDIDVYDVNKLKPI